MDPFSILSLVGAAIPGLVDAFSAKPVPGFTSESEYLAARNKYNAAVRSGNPMDARTITELEPAITQWEQMKEREGARQAQVTESLRRLDETQETGTRSILNRQYGQQGIRGQGAIHDPIKELAKQIRYQKEDINTGLAGQQMIERQNMENQAMAQRYKQQSDTNSLIGQFGSLGFNIGGEFRQGGAFGGPSELEQLMQKQNKLMKSMYQFEPGFTGPQENMSFL